MKLKGRNEWLSRTRSNNSLNPTVLTLPLINVCWFNSCCRYRHARISPPPYDIWVPVTPQHGSWCAGVTARDLDNRRVGVMVRWGPNLRRPRPKKAMTSRSSWRSTTIQRRPSRTRHLTRSLQVPGYSESWGHRNWYEHDSWRVGVAYFMESAWRSLSLRPHGPSRRCPPASRGRARSQAPAHGGWHPRRGLLRSAMLGKLMIGRARR